MGNNFTDGVPISATTATVYATIAETQEYFDDKLNVEAWDDATTANKTKALAMATIAIDRLSFIGVKADEDQAAQFPRDTDTSVPDDIKKACSELALTLLDGVDPDIEFANLTLISNSYAGVRSTYDVRHPAENIAAGIPSIEAWRFLRPYLRDSRIIRLNRVS